MDTLTPPLVRRCGPADRDPALATVLAAFAGDPLLRWVWPSEDRYLTGAGAMFGLLLDLRTESGEVWVATADEAPGSVGSVGSVAMWDPPGGLYQPAAEGRWDAVKARWSASETAAWASFDAAMAVPADAGPHWYLGVLATAPERQGSGLGRAVTAPMLAAADRARLPAYLETMSSENVAIYRRLGFEVVREVGLAGGGPRCFLMRREPDVPFAS